MKALCIAVLVLLFSVYGQAMPEKPKPYTTTPAPPTPNAAFTSQPINQAGGLDALCQSGFNGPQANMKDGQLDNNSGAQTKTLADAAACIGFINGWYESLDEAYVEAGNHLWHIQIAPTFDARAEALALHKHMTDNPLDTKQPSALILLETAVESGVARVQMVEFQSSPDPNSPQSEKPQSEDDDSGAFVTTLIT